MLNLTKKWMTEIYKPHREKLLCDIELSKIPETMPAAERFKAIEKEKALRQDIRDKIKNLEHEIYILKGNLNESLRNEIILGRGGAVGAEPTERKVFFMSCPASNCNGMLSTQYKCGICEMYACSACHEIIGVNKTVPHTCDPNNVASAEMIKKETKQCPGCHNRIYRIEGCSQMWCTGCHTAFDWNSGRKVTTERLHNPHWLEYQRSQNGGQVQRAPGDVPCGGLSTIHQVRTLVNNLPRTGTPNPLVKIVQEKLYRLVSTITLNEVRVLREQCQGLRDFEQLRVQYILGKKTKEEMATQIFRSDRKLQKSTELVYVFELLSAVGIDMFRHLIASPLRGEELQKIIEEQMDLYRALCSHCNGLFAVISNTYNQTVPQINKDWEIETKKFNSKTMTKVGAAVPTQ